MHAKARLIIRNIMRNYIFYKGKPLNQLLIKDVLYLYEKYGIVVFRSFDINNFKLKKFVDKFTLKYSNDASRRNKSETHKEINSVDTGLQPMNLHSEASFSPSWPEILWFYCSVPPKKYGQTTLCDGEELWKKLSYKTKNFFLKNPLIYKMEIPINVKVRGNIKKTKWYFDEIGTHDCFIDNKKGIINIKQIRFAVSKNFRGKLSFCNHLISSALEMDPTIKSIGILSGIKIPKSILNEVTLVSQSITYMHTWKKNDLIMINNHRFMHGRTKIVKNDERKILNLQTLKSKFF